MERRQPAVQAAERMRSDGAGARHLQPPMVAGTPATQADLRIQGDAVPGLTQAAPNRNKTAVAGQSATAENSRVPAEAAPNTESAEEAAAGPASTKKLPRPGDKLKNSQAEIQNLERTFKS